MNKPYFKILLENDDIQLYEDTREKLPAEREGRFYLYDEYHGVNLSIGATTEWDAFIETIDYYRCQLIKYKALYNVLNDKVDSFVSQFIDEEGS